MRLSASATRPLRTPTGSHGSYTWRRRPASMRRSSACLEEAYGTRDGDRGPILPSAGPRGPQAVVPRASRDHPDTLKLRRRDVAARGSADRLLAVSGPPRVLHSRKAIVDT